VLIAVVIIGCIISDKKAMRDVATHLENGDWEIVSTQDYVRDGRKCIGYRIYVDRDYASTRVFKNIFSYVTDDDGYYLHTVWIYYFSSMADGSHSADYILEQTRQGELPEPEKQ
jgi:glucose/arabinose dehydrogenase